MGEEAIRLAVIGIPVAITKLRTISLYVTVANGTARREKVLSDWYRSQLKALVPELLEKWEQVIGVKAAAWDVKWMKTKWGTCNIRARRIWLNLELVKKPVHWRIVAGDSCCEFCNNCFGWNDLTGNRYYRR